MDPLRGLIHLGLKVTETTLDRALGVVRLADTLLVTTAATPTSDRETVESVWPEEEQADLDALSSTLRARDEGGAGAATKAPSKKAAAKKVPAKKAPAKTAATPEVDPGA